MTTETTLTDPNNGQTTEVKSTSSPNSGQMNKKKKKFKMPSALAIIIGVVIFATLVSWIPHAAGKATAINVDGHAYDAGSLGAWQNWIIWNALGDNETFGDMTWASKYTANDVDSIIESYGLEGAWVEASNAAHGAAGFVTSTGTPWTLAAYSDGAKSMFGMLDVPAALFGGYFYAKEVAFYLIGIYAIVLLLMETDTLKDGVSSLVRGLGNRELLLVPILFVLFALGGTLFGMQEETLGLLPIIVPVLIVAGFDAATGMLVAVLGTTTGIAASVLDPFSVGVMAGGLGKNIGTAIAERMLLFVIYATIGSLFVTWYAARVRKNENKSCDKDAIEANKAWAEENIGDIHELETMNGKQKAALTIFALVFAWMVFSLMPWTTWFSGLKDNKGWVIFSSLFYGHVLLGEWYFVQLAILFLIAVFVIGKIFKMDNSKIAGTVWKSTREMFGVISIIAFSRATSIILTSTGTTYGMIYSMVDTDKLGNMSIIAFTLIWLLIFTMMAFFIPSTSGLAGVTAPIAGGVISTQPADAHQSLMIVGVLMAYPLAQGVVNMFSPTTGLVVVQAEQSKVSFGKVLPILAGYAATIFIVGIIMISLVLGLEVAHAGI